MIFSVYSIRDHLTGFMTPVLEQSDAVAMRNFEMSCAEMSGQRSLMTFRPSDFSLYRIATFDTDSGLFSVVSPPELVCQGGSFK